MNTLGIILIVLTLLFSWLEVTAIVKHIFESKLGVMVFEIVKPQFQFIVHSAMVQMALAFILNYERGFFISIHILNLHFCFIYIPKKYRVAHPAMVHVQGQPTQNIIEWITNAIEQANIDYPEGDTFYFKAMQQGYSLDDIDKAINHFRDIGGNVKYNLERQEIEIKIRL